MVTEPGEPPRLPAPENETPLLLPAPEGAAPLLLSPPDGGTPLLLPAPDGDQEKDGGEKKDQDAITPKDEDEKPDESGLSTPFIRRPVATTLLMLAIAVVGVIAYFLLPVAALPEIDLPTISVSATYPGADPEVMASAIAQPLERQFAVLPNVREITSQNGFGTTQISVQFDLSRKVDGAAADVQSAIQAAQVYLPTDLPQPPTYRKVNPADQPVIILGLTSKTLPLTTVNEYADTYIAQRLSQIKGVSQILIIGQQKFAPTIRVNPAALAARGIGLDTVATAITNSTSEKPLGVLQGAQSSYQIAANSQILDADAYADLPVAYKNGAPVRLRDVGDVVVGAEQPLSATWINQDRGIELAVQRQPGSNLIQLVAAVKKALPKLTRDIPKSIQVSVLSDRSRSIQEAFKDVQLTLLFTIMLVVAVIFVFLRQVWATVIPAFAVPLSILFTFSVMYPLGYDLDNLSLMGLTLAVGLVIDDAIVVLENVTRHLEMGKSPLEAAIAGSREIAFTVMSITISLIAVFIPIFLMSGVVGAMFREFAVVVATSIVASAFVSLTLTPMMAAIFLRQPDKDKESRFSKWSDRTQRRIEDKYKNGLGWILDHQFATMMATLGLIVLTALLFMCLPTGFFPNENTGLIFAYTEGSENISFNAMAARQQAAEQVVLADPDVESAGSSIGASGSTVAGNTGRMFITLRSGGNAQKVMDRLRPKLADVAGLKTWMQLIQNVSIGGSLTRSQYQYALRDIDLQELNAFAPKLEARLKTIPGLQDVATDEEVAGARMMLTIDRDVAARLGVSVNAIQATLSSAFGQRWVTQIYAPLNTYHVMLEVSPEFQQDPNALDRIYVQSSSGAVPLSEVAQFEAKAAPLAVNHSSQFPAVTLSFDLAPGTALGTVQKAIHKAELDLNMPPGIEGRFQGTAAAFTQSLATQPYLILGAVLAVYIILGILYESFFHPITILLSLPPAAVGALAALKLFGFDLSIVAIIGLIMLIGIVKKNAIMMIDFALQRLRGEMSDDGDNDKPPSPRDAIQEAAVLRFRPIMMTSLAAIIGALPIALGIGAGSDLRQPLGVAVVAGLLISQILTLFTVPVTFLYLERASRWSSKKFSSAVPAAAEAG
jgi:hydrophobe/amphiphile efflux-1 (HAE1) family protein